MKAEATIKFVIWFQILQRQLSQPLMYCVYFTWILCAQHSRYIDSQAPGLESLEGKAGKKYADI